MRILFFVLWVPIAAVLSLGVARLAWRETRTVLVALLAGLVAAAGLVAFPWAVRDTAAAARHDRGFLRSQTHRPGGPEDCLNQGLCVNRRVWDELRRLIPEHDRYYVQAHRAAIVFWTVASLLPRTPVGDPREADWVIAYRADPHTLDVRYAKFVTIHRVYVGGSGELVLAQVAR